MDTSKKRTQERRKRRKQTEALRYPRENNAQKGKTVPGRGGKSIDPEM